MNVFSQVYRKFLCTLLLGCITLIAWSQKVYTISDVPNVQVTDQTQFVSDPDLLIEPSVKTALNDSLAQFRKMYQVDFAIVVLPSIGNAAIEDFSVRLFRTWGLGNKKANNGLLLLVVMDQRAMRFEVGYGLEGVMTDAMSASIQRHHMIPYFKEGDYSKGVLEGIKAISTILRTGELPEVEHEDEEDLDPSVLFFGMGIASLFIGAVIWGSYRQTLKRINTPQQARAQWNTLQQNKKDYLILIGILCLPLLYFLYRMSRKEMTRIGTLMRKCPQCGTENMQALPAQMVPALLSPVENLEQKIGSRKYSAYECAHCKFQEISKIDVPHTAYENCPRCNAKTYRREKNVTRFRKGIQPYLRLHYKCLACSHEGYKDEKDFTGGGSIGAFPLGRGRGFGGGSLGGGSIGGGWGGGMSGGGGATGRW